MDLRPMSSQLKGSKNGMWTQKKKISEFGNNDHTEQRVISN